MLITTAVTDRVVRIRSQETGTGFFVERGGRQFLVTAAHVVKSNYVGERLEIDTVSTSGAVTIKRKEVLGDAAILVVDREHVSPPCLFGASFYIGQDVTLVGFPAGRGERFEIDRGDPEFRLKVFRPFLRRGIVSNGSTNDEFIVDSLLQKGFSGGPVVAQMVNSEGRVSETPAIIGVISSGIVFDGDRVLLDDHQGVTIRSGFTCCLHVSRFQAMMDRDVKDHPAV